MNNKEQLENNSIAVCYEAGGQKIKLTPKIVQDYLVGTKAKITLPEFKYFTEMCQTRKLNPFLKEAYIIKYSDNEPATIVVGKDAIEKRAVLNPLYDGIESGIIVTKPNESDTEIIRNGTFKLPNETLVGGWAKVYRKDWSHPSYCSVTLAESIQTKKDGTPNKSWSKQPATMIEKVAKVRALRSAFVEELGGMYDIDEMNVELPELKEEDRIIVQDDENIPEAEIKDDSDIKQYDINEL